MLASRLAEQLAHDPSKPRRWMSIVLCVAALYNLLWGAFVVLFPLKPFEWAGMEPPNYPEIWQCVGMIVGVYGVGYAAAALDPYRHWPIVLVGLLGKVLGPIGFAGAAWRGRLPWRAGWTIVTNDLSWWLPFSLILSGAYTAHVYARRVSSPEVMRLALRVQTQDGATLDELNQLTPVLLVFLRHTGCMFCREALADLSACRQEIEQRGARLVLVYMTTYREGLDLIRKYDLQDAPQVSDPHQALYRAFGLRRGTLMALFGPQLWLRAAQATLRNGHGVGWLAGDLFQMPGAFVMYHGEAVRAYRHHSIADRPDYVGLLSDYSMPPAF